MTNAQILAVCRSNWEYRGIDDTSVREMLDELSAHLEDAQAAGRTGQDVVGRDVRSFAATWARARAPLSRRVLRTASLACLAIGCVLLISYLRHWTTKLAVTPDYLAFWVVLGVATVTWELRRGSLGMRAGWALGLATALPAGILTSLLAGDGVLFTLPLWAAPFLLLPGLPYAVADARAKKSGPADDEVAVGLPGR
ncbi:hypothetical protein [Streptomyces sp. AP-93]|uniref:hypothetical protein n=1 Tax=Streptomyces sp. AP-93 TaxID=2929048 RepID=UPI001FAF90CF|nr:hypothetical protein [Streptomyces sp. AP-93]MCJ0873725.1 hypothetical protein [Streptomyces sp. AP-93]